MTISRKEFARYSRLIQDTRNYAATLREAPWWRPSLKQCMLGSIRANLAELEEALAARISKPRPRKGLAEPTRSPLEVYKEQTHDA